MVHGFNDWNVVPEHSVRIYEALKGRGIPLMAYYHQGGHGGAPPLPLRNLWFSKFLYGVDNGVDTHDPKGWIVRARSRRSARSARRRLTAISRTPRRSSSTTPARSTAA